MLRRLCARPLARALHATPPRRIELPKLESISMREYRIAAKMKQRFQPPAHREFMDLMAALSCAPAAPGSAFDARAARRSRGPPTRAAPPQTTTSTSTTRRSRAREACEAAGEEAESKRKGQKASTNYHLSRHLRR